MLKEGFQEAAKERVNGNGVFSRSEDFRIISTNASRELATVEHMNKEEVQFLPLIAHRRIQDIIYGS